MNNLQDQTLDSCRAGLTAAVDMMNATAQGTERLHTHQLATITQALAENAGLSVQIHEAKSLDDVMAVYTALAGIQVKYLSAYWGGVHKIVSENHAALQNLAQTQGTELQHHLATSLEVAMNGGPEPVVEAVKATVTAITAGLSTLARATAATAKLAAAHVAAADTGAQPATNKSGRANNR